LIFIDSITKLIFVSEEVLHSRSNFEDYSCF